MILVTRYGIVNILLIEKSGWAMTIIQSVFASFCNLNLTSNDRQNIWTIDLWLLFVVHKSIVEYKCFLLHVLQVWFLSGPTYFSFILYSKFSYFSLSYSWRKNPLNLFAEYGNDSISVKYELCRIME